MATRRTRHPASIDNHENQNQLETLRAEMVSLRAAYQSELEALHAEVANLRTAINPAAAPSAIDLETATAALDVSESLSPASTTSTTRRNLLKWGGLGAAAALAATSGAVLTSQTAHASDGGSLLLGNNNTAEHLTTLTYNGSETAPIGFSIENSGSSFSTGMTIFAGPNGTGLLASTLDGGTGISGQSDTGVGVEGIGQFGIDFHANGSGRILQTTASFTGAPTSGTYSIGEQFRDHKGDLYICIASGTPGTWRKVAAGVPGVSGALNFLTNPIRLLDTRVSPGTPWNAGSTNALQVTGVVVGGISVPSGAIGVVGNVTVVSPSAGGDLRLYPGASAPATSSINFATGWTIANGVTVGLDSSGKLNIKVDMPASTHTHVLFDASAYIL